MPSRALSPCTYPGCNVLTQGGRCSKHGSIVRDPAVKSLYNSGQWRAMRARQLASHPWCQACLERGIYEPAEEVDHIKPHRGNPRLFFDDTNLQSLSKRCHSQKTAQETLSAPDTPA